ncbi:MAG TPA: calcium-binding protein [Falsiroseomonas sp.]|nr:calcium-binding protein [Falsiroseomonas sp.]
MEVSGDVIVEWSGGGVDTIVTSASSYTLAANLEKVVYVGQSNFVGTGNAANNTIEGGALQDSLSGPDGTDDLASFSGNDTLYAGNGSDTLDGGVGNDIMNGQAGNDSMLDDAGMDVMFGESGNDTLFGGADADALTGGAGADRLRSDSGNDALTGGSGADNPSRRSRRCCSTSDARYSRCSASSCARRGESQGGERSLSPPVSALVSLRARRGCWRWPVRWRA